VILRTRSIAFPLTARGSGPHPEQRPIEALELEGEHRSGGRLGPGGHRGFHRAIGTGGTRVANALGDGGVPDPGAAQFTRPAPAVEHIDAARAPHERIIL
jgi:hypothetical protein